MKGGLSSAVRLIYKKNTYSLQDGKISVYFDTTDHVVVVYKKYDVVVLILIYVHDFIVA